MKYQLIEVGLVSIIGSNLSWQPTPIIVRGHMSSLYLRDIIMDHLTVQPTSDSPVASTQESPSMGPAVPPAAHPVLSRLIEEVRNERYVEARYDRVHNRHNRGR